MRASQLQDATVGPGLTAKEKNEQPMYDKEKGGSIEQRLVLQLWDQLLLVKNGILYWQFMGVNGVPNHLQLILLQDLREGAIQRSCGRSPWRRENH